jgi:hypothetical protein
MPTTVSELRKQLREHFPEAHLHIPAEAKGDRSSDDSDSDPSDDGNNPLATNSPTFSTGVPVLDRLAIPPGAITEIVGHHASSGVALLTQALLQAAAEQKRHLALIDCHDHFDPNCAPLDSCPSLLWLRSEDVESSLKAADLLLRDGNLPLVVADFQLESPRALRSIATTSWHRLRSLAEKTGTTFLAFTPAPLIPTARLRVELEARFSLDALQQPRAELLTDIPLSVTRRIDQTRRQDHHAQQPIVAVAS